MEGRLGQVSALELVDHQHMYTMKKEMNYIELSRLFFVLQSAH